MFVLTMDQRGSRTHGDKVPQLLALLSGFEATLPFERSVGDEVQGLLADPGTVVEVAARVLREKDWYVGIGVGPVDLPLPGNSREASGGAFVAAREAVEAAKKTGERVPLRVRAADLAAAEWAAAAEAVLVLLGDIVRNRSEAEWRVLDAQAGAAGATQRDLAAQLGITPQAVSKAIQRAGSQEDRNGRQAATLLLRHARLATDVRPTR